MPTGKGTAPFYSLITDGRFANKLYSYLGATYSVVVHCRCPTQLNVYRCDLHFSIDISDAQHCRLRPGAAASCVHQAADHHIQGTGAAQ